MNINLKEYTKDTHTLKYIEKILAEQSVTKGLSRKLSKIIKERSEIELNLELGGECIIELDKPRLEAIQERDKMLLMLKEGDDDI